MYPTAIACGVDPERYWDMTYGEIVAAIEGYKTRRKLELEAKAAIQYEHATFLGGVISRVLGGKNKIPSLQEAFQSVFGEYQEPKIKKQQDWRVMKERVSNFAEIQRRNGVNNNGNDS
jgi:hypothetical protein